MKLVGVCFSWMELCGALFSLLPTGGKLGRTFLCEVPLYLICSVYDSLKELSLLSFLSN